jgi:hypothetical protein
MRCPLCHAAIRATTLFFVQQILVGSAYWTCEDGACGPCANSILNMKEGEGSTYGQVAIF